MVTQKQYERVQAYIRKGMAEGAEVLVGGEGQSVLGHKPAYQS